MTSQSKAGTLADFTKEVAGWMRTPVESLQSATLNKVVLDESRWFRRNDDEGWCQNNDKIVFIFEEGGVAHKAPRSASEIRNGGQSGDARGGVLRYFQPVL